ncbi:MAG: C40 family peptidase [Gordonia sp. (in: high G+C Gram-positive bacteria)]|uniref:C40 family peptidase n=1 Tax=Gordonia sp. (in: high G+C Gram-positive bacteria) TaxID=84139 RepID=UPI0039E70843
MAKHRVEQPKAARNVAKTALATGSFAIGAIALAAPAAHAAPIQVPKGLNIPGIAQKDIPQTIDVPGVDAKDIPQNLAPSTDVKKRLGLKQTRGEKALKVAESKIGSPYVYGAAGPNAFDCSGLVYYSYKQAGRTIPRDSYGQLGGGTPVPSLAQAKPGDVLIFNGGSHAGIYVGGGKFIHSSTEGVPVQRATVKSWALTGIRRYN